MVLKKLSNNSRSSQNSGTTTLQNQQTQQNTWVQQSGQPAGQTQYPRQTQFRPVVTPQGTLPVGYSGTPGGSGLGVGSGVGGVQGHRASKCISEFRISALANWDISLFRSEPFRRKCLIQKSEVQKLNQNPREGGAYYCSHLIEAQQNRLHTTVIW